MVQQSKLHPFLDWTKQRIDEMDATLATLEAQSGRVGVESKAKTVQLIANLKKRRDEFQVNAKANAESGEAALKDIEAQLDTQWTGFQVQLKAYFETAGEQLDQQQATFRSIATTQAKAWRDAADQLQATAVTAAAERRADIEVAVNQLKADAAAAEARFQQLRQAGNQSWVALSAALAKSRKALDLASQKAWEALRPTTSNPARSQ